MQPNKDAERATLPNVSAGELISDRLTRLVLESTTGICSSELVILPGVLRAFQKHMSARFKVRHGS